MRATAQVFKRAFAVQRYILGTGDTFYNFSFVVLTQPFKVAHGLVAWQHTAHYGFIFGGQFGHFFLNNAQIVRGKRALVRKVVKKAVFNHRANGDLRIWKHFLNCIGQQVCRGVTNNFQTFRIFSGNDGQRRVSLNQVTGINHLLRVS